jgi:radical SAM protein (TIGR01212 family)
VQRDPRLNLFREYGRRRWGETVGKISLYAGNRCPNRDRGGCTFCRAESYQPCYLDRQDPVELQIAKGKEHLHRIQTRLYLACFQQETSTAGEPPDWLAKCAMALNDPACVGLTLSTRPDFVGHSWLEPLQALLRSFPTKLAIIELGLQSAKEESLVRLNRNHTTADFARAVGLIRQYPILELGAHLILGIAGEDLDDMRHSLGWVEAWGVTHLKLHHLQVVKGTRLFDEYQSHPFPLPTAEQYLDWLVTLLPGISPGTILHRLWSTCHYPMLHQPRWHLKSNQIYAQLSALLEETNTFQGQSCHGSPPPALAVPHPP